MLTRLKLFGLLVLALCFVNPAPSVAFAQVVDEVSGELVVETGEPVITPASPAAAVSISVEQNTGVLDATDGTSLARAIFEAVKRGDWLEVAALLLIGVVLLLRKFGLKLHEAIPDDSIWDKPLWFVFETKPGGWGLNFLTAVAGGLAFAKAGGAHITPDVLKPILHVSLAGAGLFELVRDVWVFGKEQLAKRKSAAPPAISTPPAAP